MGMLIAFARSMGIGSGKTPDCLPKGGIPVIGKSSMIDFIAFSPTGLGTTFTTACRDTANWTRIKFALLKRAQGIKDTYYNQQLISNIEQQEDNEISYQQGSYSSSNELPQGRAKIYKDSLIVYSVIPYEVRLKYKRMLSFIPDSMVYRFYPYSGNVPSAFTGRLEVRRAQ